MTRLTGLLFALLLLAGCSGSDTPKPVAKPRCGTCYDLKIAGHLRTYRLYQYKRPFILAPNVIVVLPGFGVDLAALEADDRLDKYLTLENTDVIYADAIDELWEDGVYHPDVDARDMEFIQRIVERHLAPGGRAYAVGISNGGLFLNRLRCEKPDLFAGYVDVLAPAWADQPCPAAAPAPTLLIAAADDAMFLLQGGPASILNGIHKDREVHYGGTVLSAQQTQAFWRTKNGPGVETALIVVPRATHTWPIAPFDAPKVIVAKIEEWARRR